MSLKKDKGILTNMGHTSSWKALFMFHVTNVARDLPANATSLISAVVEECAMIAI